MSHSTSRRGFTLIELLAVVVIVVLLIGLILGVASYVDRRSKVSQAQAIFEAVTSGCEDYRLDVGRYPTSSVYRFSSPNTYWETRNNAMLLEQLAGSGKRYLHLPAAAIRLISVPPWSVPVCEENSPSNPYGWTYTAEPYTMIMDPWGQFFRYYCTYPRITTATTNVGPMGSCNALWNGNPYVATWSNSATIGRQANVEGYDFWSFGSNAVNNDGKGDDLGNFR